MGALTRYQDWPSRLAAALADVSRSELRFGELDCCLFAANMVRAITGVDVAADLRGRYSSEKEAYALMSSLYGGTDETIVALAERAGLEEVKSSLAQRGDVVLAGLPRLSAAGIIGFNQGVTVFYGKLSRLPMKFAMRAWRV